MKGLKSRLKKGMVFALSLAMAAGLAPAMSGGADTVQAAEGAAEPEVSLYATKNQMMDDTFKPGADGTAANYGKLKFGKNRWYILGKDDVISGDNTIIFAAGTIPNTYAIDFNTDQNNKTYSEEYGVYENRPSQVGLNHYGASNLRAKLNTIATDDYFTSAEKNLINDTTVKTVDHYNSDAKYTTTDKLHALAGNENNSNTIRAGSGEGTVVLAESKYWNKGENFWLRSLDATDKALYAQPGGSVKGADTVKSYYIRPASNLNLTNVLFASAAEAATSDAVVADLMIIPEEGMPMTLRLDGSSKEIGTVTYNIQTGEIKATKGTTAGAVALVVQGRNEYANWYYSKQITGPDRVAVSENGRN